MATATKHNRVLELHIVPKTREPKKYNPIYDIKTKSADSMNIDAPFDEGKAKLKKYGYREITLEENAKLRILEGKDAFVSEYGNWVAEDFIYVPGKGIYLSKNSPLTLQRNAKKATQSHEEEKEYFLTPKQTEQALENSIRIPEFHGMTTSFGIPTNRLADEELTVFALGKTAEKYGQFLKDSGISHMNLILFNNYNKEHSKPFLRKTWFRGIPQYNSDLVADRKYLDRNSRVRGVPINSSK